MTTAALAAAVISAAIAFGSFFYARRSASAAGLAADAAKMTARIESDRRHGELTPRFRIRCAEQDPGSSDLMMTIFLVGPAELERLDSLIVSIRDDTPWRAEGSLRRGEIPHTRAD